MRVAVGCQVASNAARKSATAARCTGVGDVGTPVEGPPLLVFARSAYVATPADSRNSWLFGFTREENVRAGRPSPAWPTDRT